MRRYFGRLEEVREKSPGDWVSEADLASEKAIRELLTRESGLPVYGEEAGGDDFDTGWLVDPLDGTSNFLHGFDAVGVSVGLIEDGVPVVGVVHAPLLDRTFYAARGVGAFRDERPLHVSDARRPSRRSSRPASRSGTRSCCRAYERALAAALRGFEDLRRVGAASLDLCWTAEGVFDGYFELRLGPWDVAAGGVIVREAGGVVTDWDGDDRAWLRSGDILAGPPAVHAALARRRRLSR